MGSLFRMVGSAEGETTINNVQFECVEQGPDSQPYCLKIVLRHLESYIKISS